MGGRETEQVVNPKDVNVCSDVSRRFSDDRAREPLDNHLFRANAIIIIHCIYLPLQANSLHLRISLVRAGVWGRYEEDGVKGGGGRHGEEDV